MKDDELARLLVSPDITLRQCISAIDRGAKGIVLVIDAQGTLLNTITDGDIRRAILTGSTLNEPVTALIASKAPPVTADIYTPHEQIIALMRKHVMRHVPILHPSTRQLLDLVMLDHTFAQTATLEATIMAGGFGTRLRPLTENLPKPMLPVAGKPLIERIVTQLRDVGIRKVNITTHYMPEKIIDHFGDGSRFGLEINYVNEAVPLGTGGALSIIPLPKQPFLVINGDILTQIDFRAMLAYHREHHAMMTVAVRAFEYQVPYGVVNTQAGLVTSLIEKPKHSYFVNAGIYLIEPSVYDIMPYRQGRFDMTDLVQCLLDDKKTVASFPIMEYWLDIGKHEDYEKAQLDAGAWV